MAGIVTRSFRLGGHLVEPERGVVRGPGGDVHIDQKAMHLLVLLAEDPGRVVDRKDLVRMIWNGAPGGDAALTVAVSRLRHVLADDKAHPRFIETRRNRGYRLLVAPEPVERRADGVPAKVGSTEVDLASIFHVRKAPALEWAERLRLRSIQFLVNLRKRKLVQWAIAYLAFAWAVLQALDLVADSYGWPQLVMRLSFELAALGFPIVLVVAWYHGERGEQRVSGMELMILALLLGIGGVILLRPGMLHQSFASLRGTGSQTEAAQEAKRPPPANALSKTVVAVLPFSATRASGDSEFLGEGLADELITRLAQVPGLSVMARTSSFMLATDRPDIPAIAKQLGAGLIVVGELEEVSPNIRLKISLVDAAGRELLVQTYNRPREDILELQTALTGDVLRGIQARFGIEIGELMPPPGMTTKAEAYRIFLRGRHYLAGRSAEDLRQCLVLYLKAIALDPGFAQAYEGLAVAYRKMADMSYDSARTAELNLLSLRMAQQALALDPDLAEAYVINGDGDGDRDMQKSHQWNKLTELYAHTIGLEPNNPTLRLWHSVLLRDMGYLNEATWEAAVASRLDPLNPAVNNELGWAYYLSGQTEAAMQHALHSMDAGAHGHHLVAVRIEAERGDFDAARSIIDAAPDTGTQEAAWMRLLLDAMQRPERKPTVLSELDRAVAVETAQVDLFTAFSIYAYLGEKERALAVLKMALAPGYQGAPEYFQMWAPAFGYLRETREFHDLMERVGLAEYWRGHGWPDYCKAAGEDFRCF